MINAGIHHGDRVFSTRRESFSDGQIVTALVPDPATDEPTFTVKVYERKKSIVTLYSRNDDVVTFKPMVFDTNKVAIQVMGVFSGLIRGSGL